MGLWDDLLSVIGLGGSKAKTHKKTNVSTHSKTSNETASTRKSQPISKAPSPGDIFRGRIEHIGDSFVKVESGKITAVIFLNEMADRFINHPGELLTEGQNIDFVLLSKGPKGWVASMKAVAEAKARKALANVNKDDIIKGKVITLNKYCAYLDVGLYRARIPLAEISWNFIDHPSEAISLGDEIQAKVMRVELPDDWLNIKRNRRAQAIASRRICLEKPISPLISVAFSCLPFTVLTVAKTPMSCDPVVLYILEELSDGRTKDEIATTTGLPEDTLINIYNVLQNEGLAENWHANANGKRLIEAVTLERDMNNDPIRGLFASAASLDSKFIPIEALNHHQEYPRDWPRPTFNKFAEDIFVRAADDALPESMIEQIVSDNKRQVLSKLQEDSRLRVFLRRDGPRPWIPVYIEIPEYWFLAGLCSAFEPFFGKPYRPVFEEDTCRYFLMVQCHAVSKNNEKPLETVFYEPYTSTVWRLKEGKQIETFFRHGSSFPKVPTLGNQIVCQKAREVVDRIIPKNWCSVRV